MAGAAGAGTAKWMSDKVTADVDRTTDKVAAAAKNVFKDLKLTLTKEANVPEVTQLQARYADGRRVWVDIRPISGTSSRVDVRVGWMDGSNDARDIRDKIVARAQSWI